MYWMSILAQVDLGFYFIAKVNKCTSVVTHESLLRWRESLSPQNACCFLKDGKCWDCFALCSSWFYYMRKFGRVLHRISSIHLYVIVSHQRSRIFNWNKKYCFSFQIESFTHLGSSRHHNQNQISFIGFLQNYILFYLPWREASYHTSN